MFFHSWRLGAFMSMVLLFIVGCSESKPRSRELPPTLQASELRVLQLDDQKNESSSLVTGLPIQISGVLSSQTEVLDKVLVRIEDTKKDGTVVITQSGFGSVTERSDGIYHYHASLSPVNRPGRYAVNVVYMNKEGTKIDSTDIEIKAGKPPATE